MWLGSQVIAFAAVLLVVMSADAGAQSTSDDGRSEAERTYQSYYATCHGADGMGEPGKQLYSIEMPDFTDCSFVTREPDADFFAVAHEGGTVRAFSRIMPAHGKTLGEEGVRAALTHIRGFCSDARWPRGELNLLRPLFTEKAYPEDEAVITVDANANRERDVRVELLFEKRIGPKSQLEVALPFRARGRPPGRGTSGGGGIGDVSVGWMLTPSGSDP